MSTVYPITEHEHTINGVPGRMFTVHEPQEVCGRLVHRNQTWKSEGRAVSGYGPSGTMYVTIRFDDGCQNGRQSFAITADVYMAAGGCMHEEIAKRFPALAPLIKWHLTDTGGPMHYVANTCYHAGDRDCNGLRKDESRQIRNGRTGQLAWILGTTQKLPQYVDSDTCPTETATQRYVPWCRIGEGKQRDFAAARSCAVWPEATDEQLSLERPELEALLLARLPGLIADFRADMMAAGFMWEPEVQPC